MRKTFRRFAGLAVLATGAAAHRSDAQSTPPTPMQQLVRDVYNEIIEFNSVNIGGGTTDVANALAKRFRDAGFLEQDIFLGGIQPNKYNLVVRYHGTGKRVANTIEATQKVVGGFTVTATNRGGHASLPRPDNGIYELAQRAARRTRHDSVAQRGNSGVRNLRADGGSRRLTIAWERRARAGKELL